MLLTEVTDGKIAPKVQMPRWNVTVHHSTNTATADACIQDFCTAITMQCFSYAIRSQSCSADLNSTGRVYNVHYSTRIPGTSEIASIACLHDFSGPALLSCSKILTYQLLGSQLWTALPLEKSRSPATVNKVSKSRHNSRTKL